MKLFHGTRQHDITELRPSKGGEYGPGVYLTPLVQTAWFYATHVAQGTDKPIVLVVEVEIDPQKVFETTKQDWLKMTAGKDRSSVQKKLMKKGYQAISSTGLSGSDLQFVLFDPTYATITGRLNEHVGSKQKARSPRASKDLAIRPNRSSSRVGSTFDPAIAFDGNWNSPSWQTGSQWLDALNDEFSYLLICALVERFALPLYLIQRPNVPAGAKAIRKAIKLGRQMAEGRSAPETQRQTVEEELVELRGEDQAYVRTLPPRPNSMEYEAARMCLYAASYCVYTTPDVSVAYSYIRYGIQNSLFREPNTEEKFQARMSKVDEVGQDYIRLSFQQAEQHAYAEGYPTLMGDPAKVVLATIYRKNMIDLMLAIRAKQVSDIIDAKLSMADHVMRHLDQASVYLSNRGGKISMWKQSTIDNISQMMVWQLLLNNHKNRFLSEVIGPLKALPKAEFVPPKKPKKGDKIGAIQLWQGAGLTQLASIGAGDPLITQCVLVEKRIIPTRDQAIALVQRLKFSTAYLTESKDHWRFQQQSPKLFSANSFITKPITNGVKALLAAHKPEIAKSVQSKKGSTVGAFAMTLSNEYNSYFEVFKNPTQQEIRKEFPRGVARGLLIGKDAYFWPAGSAIHSTVMRELARSRPEAALPVIFYFRPGQVSIIFEDALQESNSPSPLSEYVNLLREHPYIAHLMRRVSVRLRTGDGDTDWANLADQVGAGTSQDTLDDMMEADVAKLSPSDRRRFNIDCATLLLPLFEVKYPNDKRPQRAIEAAKVFLSHQRASQSMEEARAAAWDVIVDFWERKNANDPRIQLDPEYPLIEDEAFAAAYAASEAASSPEHDSSAWTWVANAFKALEIKKQKNKAWTSQGLEKARKTGWRDGRARARKLLLKYL